MPKSPSRYPYSLNLRSYCNPITPQPLDGAGELDRVLRQMAIQHEIETEDPARKIGDLYSAYRSMPNLQCFWPCSDHDGEFEFSLDYSGHEYHLSNMGWIIFETDVGLYNDRIAYINFPDEDARFGLNTGHYSDLTGSELPVIGLTGTFGAWFRCEEEVANQNYTIMILEGQAGATQAWSYRLVVRNNKLRAQRYTNTNNTLETIDSANTNQVGINQWHFGAWRFDYHAPSMSVFLDGQTTTNDTIEQDIAASGSVAGLQIGARLEDNTGLNTTEDRLIGDLSFIFQSSRNLPDSYLNYLYELGKPIFA